MKILFSAYACEPGRGSEYGYGWYWPKYIAQIGHEVWVLTNSDGKESIKSALIEEPLDNVHFIFIGNPSWIAHRFQGHKREVIGYLVWQQQAYKTAKGLEQKHNFDLIHHITFGSITAGSWAWKLNKPFVFGPVGGGQVAPRAFKKYFFNQWPKEALRSFVYRNLDFLNGSLCRTVSRAALVLATNRDTMVQAQKLGARRVELFHDPGLPENYIPPTIPKRSNSPFISLLWTGRILMRKGLPLTLEAVSKASQLIPLKLTILGGGDCSNYVPRWIKEFKLQRNVDYRGQVPWLELKSEYAKHDVFIFTSLRDSCPAQLLEAMAYGLPIITLSLHGAADFVPEGAGIKIPASNPEATIYDLAEAIRYLFENPLERQKMGAVGYEYAKTQTWTQKAIRMSDCYKKLSNSAYSVSEAGEVHD